MRHRLIVALASAAGLAAATVWGASSIPASASGSTSGTASQLAADSGVQGIHKIKHVVVIYQENRSFDSYFGTFPGADGIQPGVCVHDPRTGKCVKPYVDHKDSNEGGPHAAAASAADVDNGKMNGFIAEAQKDRTSKGKCKPTGPCPTDVMGHHSGSDIRDYWAYARNFVLQDHMYEDVHSWSFPEHMMLFSGWSADCSTQSPMSCKSNDMPKNRTAADPTPFEWTDLTYLLHKDHVSWKVYLDGGAVPPGTRAHKQAVPIIWNTLPGFRDVHQDGQTGNIAGFTPGKFNANTLPAVSWILPDGKDSEHPTSLVSTGQAYTTRIINAIMRSKNWDSTAIFLAWDDWGGFYDGVNPKAVDKLGYGIRVAAMMISPYARRGVDHQTLSPDAYLKFIEDDFLHGARLNPKTDGRPDSRPVVREKLLKIDWQKEFNFSQQPRSPLILNPCPPSTTLTPHPGPNCNGLPAGGVPAEADGD